MAISLRPIDRNNWEECIALSVGVTQLGQVSTNVRSLAECAVRPEATPVGIYDDDKMVGFIMYLRDPDTELYDIYRIMVDFKHQNKGIGRKALELLIEKMRTFPDRGEKVMIMFLVENTSVERLYKRVGFVDSGKTVYNERWRYTERLFYYFF
jgi:diamine N-acetyltransferase